MKTRHLLIALLLLSSATLSIFSCKKQPATEQAEELRQVLNIEQLAVKYTSPIGNDLQALREKYSSLNINELKQFWLEINKINRQTIDLTQQQVKDITKWVEDNNSKSIAKFGKPFNQISGKRIHDIIYENEITSHKPPPPPPPGCTLYTYTLSFIPVQSGIGSPAANQFYSVNPVAAHEDRGPCSSVEYVYTGTNWTNMLPITPLAVSILIDDPNFPSWPWHVRTSGGTTIVYASKVFVENAFGSLENFNNHVRLAIYVDPCPQCKK